MNFNFAFVALYGQLARTYLKIKTGGLTKGIVRLLLRPNVRFSQGFALKYWFFEASRSATNREKSILR